MRILFVAAGPANEDTLRLDAEHRDIQGRIRASTNRERVVLETLLAARPRDLIDALNRFTPTVLHISGHASSATGIALENDEGLAVDVSGDQLLRLVSVSDPSLRLVVLNSCESANHARPLTANVDAAIGMIRSVNDAAAVEFAAQLYSSLAEGVPVGRSMEQACLQLSLTGLPDDHQPTLYSSPSVDVTKMTLT